MAKYIEAPPINIIGEILQPRDSDNGIRFYLDYEYLALKNISVIMKGVNELYELVYIILNEENVPEDDQLILKYAATGNSFEWLGQILGQFNSPKAKAAILITAALIYTPIGVEKYNRDVATRYKIEAEIEKTKAETKKIETEKYSIDLENLYKKNKLNQDSITKLNSEKNRKRIMRKRSSVKRAIEHPAIKVCVINNITIKKEE